MLVRDAEGKYILEVDKQRRIVYEKNIGLWKKEDFERFDNDYMNKIIPYLGAGSWSKQSDLRQYNPSTVISPELIGEYVKRCVDKGFKCAATLIDSVTLKMQLNRSTKNLDWEQCYFDEEKEADAWLREKGF